MDRALVVALALTAAAATWPGAAARVPANGTITGQVVSPEPTPDLGRPAVGALGATPPDPIDRRTAVVYLDPAPEPALDEVPTGRARMDQRNETFIPHVLAITVGSVVDFPNDDTTFHNVFSLSKAKTFDLGRYPAGHSKSVVFDKAGIVPISCDIHTHMSAYILVFNHVFFAVTGEGGRYTIPNVPPGTYTVRVWSEIARGESRTVTVLDGGTAEASFHLDRR